MLRERSINGRNGHGIAYMSLWMTNHAGTAEVRILSLSLSLYIYIYLCVCVCKCLCIRSNLQLNRKSKEPGQSIGA